jgi:hypothetical protein
MVYQLGGAMNKNPVVKPARTIPIKNTPVLLFCKCRVEVSGHPTERCQQFKGDHILVVREVNGG